MNPYRLNYFTILRIGPHVRRGAIPASRRNLVASIRRGKPHVVAGHNISEAEVQEAEARLLRDETWLEESLLVHPMPVSESSQLRRICAEVSARTAPPRQGTMLRLANLPALAPLVPRAEAIDLPWPECDTTVAAGPTPDEERRADIQFDL